MTLAGKLDAARAVQARKIGQSLWFDNISRGLIESGELRGMIDGGIITGITTNPTIFQNAVDGSDSYDRAIAELKARKATVEQAYEQLTVADVSRAADLLLPVWEASRGADGYVSLELPPDLAHDADASVEEARRLVRVLERPNVMIKVPGTPAGVEAFRRLTEAGLNINVTLLFSLRQYEAIAQAYVAALRARAARQEDVGGIASVASFFVSRVDTVVDRQLGAVQGEGMQERARSLLGKAGIANCKIVYQRFQEIFGQPFADLRKKGARPQRVLWASTSTKNPDYRDVMYVDTLLGKDTVNTLPPATLHAFLDHGVAQRATLEDGLHEARRVLADLADLGVDLEAVCEKLQEDGVEAFARSFRGLQESLQRKLA